MHLITARYLLDAAERFPQQRMAIVEARKFIEKGYFPNPEELRKVFPSLDNFKYLDKHYVINLANNELRLIALIFFESQKFYVRHIFTHKEYDRFIAQHRSKGKKK
ncbi:type II toxin-antitoxin system HigB family toxin [Phytobacter sp. V91]|uniref:type II toxin-antitoxin system HigB family toxin n=1 Tax=Phytobacter sp. V91 TaxID=3369425 RepID=UPI003F5D9112